MSTKISIKYGKGYHLYEECFDGENIYLSISCEFEANNKGITIKIPRQIWNEIITTGKLKIVSKEKMREMLSEGIEYFSNLIKENKNG